MIKNYGEYKKNCAQKVYGHPCYSKRAHRRFGRVHLPVAPKCNIKCNYCQRKHDCANENRPGVASKIITPEEGAELVRRAVAHEPRIRVAGIAGPGDPLANKTTFETFRLIKEEFPFLTNCMSTNGLLLPEKLDDLEEVGVGALTITINAVDPKIGSKIYSFVRYRNKTLHGREAFELLNHNQLEGLKGAVERGMVVKVNSVYIPSVNGKHLPEVARTVRELGAYIMNVMPLIPQANFSCLNPPTGQQLKEMRDACGEIMLQFRNCVQCRADAIGIPGEEGCTGGALKEKLYSEMEVKQCF